METTERRFCRKCGRVIETPVEIHGSQVGCERCHEPMVFLKKAFWERDRNEEERSLTLGGGS
jgi:hypothetical protein